MKCNQPRQGFELVSPCSFTRTITVIPRALMYVCMYMSIYVCVCVCYIISKYVETKLKKENFLVSSIVGIQNSATKINDGITVAL